MIRIDALAIILEKPAILPKAPKTMPNSPNAPPIAVNPRPISSQDISAKFFNPSDIFSRDCTAIKIATAPNMDLPPPNLLRTDIATTNSVNAPPMAVNPRPISSQDKVENF